MLKSKNPCGIVTEAFKIGITNTRGIFYLSNFYITKLISQPPTSRPLCSSRLMPNKKSLFDQLLLGSNLLKNVRPGQTFFELTTPMGHTYFFQKRHSDAQRWRSLLRTSPRTRPRKLPGSAGVTNK